MLLWLFAWSRYSRRLADSAGWRARPGYGRSRGLPPGSLALAPLDPWRDHLFYLKQAARYGPIFKMSNFIQPMVCVVGFKPALELLRTYDQFLGFQPLPFNRFIPRGFDCVYG